MEFEKIHPSLFLVNGPQGQGKSYLIRYIMYMMRNVFDYGIVFTGTNFDKESGSFEYIDKKYIHNKYDPKILQNLMDIQKTLIKEGKRKDAFVIFDDCIYKNMFKDETLDTLSTQLRHYFITVIFSTQYAKKIQPSLRTNCMVSVIFKTTSKSNLKALHEEYGQEFDNFNKFKDYIIKNLGEHKFIYYNSKIAGEDIEEKYKIMLCPPNIPKFKIKFKKNLS